MVTRIKQFVLTTKLIDTLSSNVQCLLEGIYTEKQVKEILMDMREFISFIQSYKNSALKAQQKPSEGNDYDGYRDLLDICDLLAHPNKNSKQIVCNLQKHIDYLKQNIDDINSNESIPQVVVIDGIKYRNSTGYETSKLVKNLLRAIQFLFSFTDNPLKDEQYDQLIREQLWNISLCMISIFQGVVLHYDLDEPPAQIFVAANPIGQVGLFCLIDDATFVKQLRSKIDNYIFYFQVLTSPFRDARLIDNMNIKDIFETSIDMDGNFVFRRYGKLGKGVSISEQQMDGAPTAI